MSKYLISEIDAADNITLLTRHTLARVRGERRMKEVEIENGKAATYTAPADHVFMMLGSDPNTKWLFSSLVLDGKGYICTGADVPADESPAAKLGRALYPHETSTPGCFAAGDVRAGSLKRVAAAVGEGAGAYFDVHRYLHA